MMDGIVGSNWVMLGMGLIRMLLVAALLLAIAELAKYVFFEHPR